MRTNLSRLAPLGFLASLLLVGSAVAQKPGVPPYNRGAPLGQPPPVPDRPPAAGTEEGEVQARGPIHEAFAQPGESSPKPSLVAPKEPPPLVEEVPPDEKPAGDNVLWIPGYWTWDEDRSDYTWVSGCWRVAPGGRKWVPGYWNKTDPGYQWVAGFWADSNATDVSYLDPPPASLDRGPSLPAPDEKNFYVPGCWLNRDSRYVWRPGYWSPERSGFVYTPPRYNWTPGGYVFVNGYWDSPLESRGVLFAPVVFPSRLYTRTGWIFSPRWTVAAPTLINSLWVRPGVGSYAFGDYYGARYAKLGFYPWITWSGRARDPLYTWYRGVNRRNPAWERGLAATYRGRVNGNLLLPPRTLVAQRRLSGVRVVRPLSSFHSGSFRLTRVTASQRAVAINGVAGYRKASVARFRSETRGPGAGARGAFVRNVPGPATARVARAGAVGGTRSRLATGSFSAHRSPARLATRGSVSRGAVSRGAVSRGGVARRATTARSTTARSTTARSTTGRSTARTGRAATSRGATMRSGVKSTSGKATTARRSVSRGASAHTPARKSGSVGRSGASRNRGHR